MVAMDDAPDAPHRSAGKARSRAPGGEPKPTATRSRAKAQKPPAAKATLPASSAANGARTRRSAAAGGTSVDKKGTGDGKGARRVTNAKKATSATAGGGDPRPAGPGRWAGRPSRSRALYNRRIQRSWEHWPLTTRLAAGLFARPEWVLGLLGGPPPVEVDGRVLNRGTQVLLELANRIPASAGGGSEAPTVFDLEVMRAQVRRISRVAMPVRTDVYAVGRVVPGAVGTPDIPVRIYRRFGAGDPMRRPSSTTTGVDG